MTKSYVRTATRTTLKVEVNLAQILNFKANFHTEFEPFFKKKNYANTKHSLLFCNISNDICERILLITEPEPENFKIVSIKIKN